MKRLRTDLEGRAAIADYLQAEFPFLEDTGVLSPYPGGRSAGLERLEQFQLEKYGKQRNFLDGEVGRLSPYISRGCIELEEVRQWALKRGKSNSVEKFVSELAWRAFFHLVYEEEAIAFLRIWRSPKSPCASIKQRYPKTLPTVKQAFPQWIPSSPC
ncbi:MAG: hypothetical protein HC878_12405 [Leptolyngbyaceae cyanobacterium SL_5_14]|nr:hypothetical protein [Leptolyngbyaceae cyanobacterium SL_5_14]